MFDREKSDALFTDTLDLLDMLNTRDGRFEYTDYVSLHNNITALYDSFSEVEEVHEFAKAKADGRLVVLPCKAGNTVYAVQGVEIIQCKVTEVTISESGISYIRLFSTDDRLADFRHEHFKRTVFLTREAAEKAIAEVVGE